jgi:DNA-binding transcriptional MerR regulator
MEELTISQTSKKFDIPAPTLRYYESIGLMDPVEKNESGHRIYKEKDFRRINFIKTLRIAGVTIEQIKEYVDLFHEGVDTIPQRKQILINQLQLLKEHAKELNRVIDELENIINNYEDTLMKRELDQRKKTLHTPIRK